MKICPKCQQERPEEQFSWHKTKKELRYSWCKDCWNAANKMRYQKDKQYYQDKANARKRAIKDHVNQYKSGKGCERCGEKHPACLDLHHIDPSTKVTEVSRMLNIGWGLARIEAEIAKCIVLCSNCHRKEHWRD